MVQTLPLDVIAAVLEHCSLVDLVVASTLSRDVQLEAERIIYRHILITKMDTLRTLLHSIDGRRGALVRRFDVLTWDDPNFQHNMDACQREIVLASRKRTVSRLLRQMPDLEYFSNDWPGRPGPDLLIKLPRRLLGLDIACDFDKDTVSVLRWQRRLLSLRMDNYGVNDGGKGIHLCRAGIWADALFLRTLETVKGPHCCVFRLLEGRSVRQLELTRMLLPQEIDNIAVAHSVCGSLEAAKIRVLSEGDRVLHHMRRFRALRHLEIMEPGFKQTPRPEPVDAAWATAESIGAAIRAFPLLQTFRLTTAFGPDFRPDDMDEESRRNLVVDWANEASPHLHSIYIAKSEYLSERRELFLGRWNMEWRRNDRAWTQS